MVKNVSKIAEKNKFDLAAARSVPVNDENWRTDNIGRLMNNAIQQFEARILQLMEDAGQGGFNLSHFAVTRNLDIEGTRATELAKRAAITKQSMGELVMQLEARGVIKRNPDPFDKRAKIVCFTKEGIAWLKTFKIALLQAENEMRDKIGSSRLELIKEDLAKYGSDAGIGRSD